MKPSRGWRFRVNWPGERQRRISHRRALERDSLYSAETVSYQNIITRPTPPSPSHCRGLRWIISMHHNIHKDVFYCIYTIKCAVNLKRLLKSKPLYIYQLKNTNNMNWNIHLLICQTFQFQVESRMREENKFYLTLVAPHGPYALVGTLYGPNQPQPVKVIW